MELYISPTLTSVRISHFGTSPPRLEGYNRQVHSACVLGSGSFGTTLAVLLARMECRVSLVCRQTVTAEQINSSRSNPVYFPEFRLPDNIIATAEIELALREVDTVYLAVPSKYFKTSLTEYASGLQQWPALLDGSACICNCTKGLLLDPTARCDAWLQHFLAGLAAPQQAPALVHLSGPNLAAEIMRGSPAAAVAAALPAQLWAAQRVQSQLMSEQFRVYTGSDPVGVEVAGFYKNVLAIAAGAVEGLGLGSNTLAALVTRGLAEMGRLVRYFGGDPATLLGLAGVGDLLATCGSPLSRNYQFGARRARGESSAEILASMQQVAEGVQTARALHEWPAATGADSGDWPELPIAQEVFRLVHEGAEVQDSILRLMRRPPRGES